MISVTALLNQYITNFTSFHQGRSQGYTPYTKYRGPRPWGGAPGASKGVFLGPPKMEGKREKEKKKKEKNGKKEDKGGKKRGQKRKKNQKDKRKKV